MDTDSNTDSMDSAATDTTELRRYWVEKLMLRKLEPKDIVSMLGKLKEPIYSSTEIVMQDMLELQRVRRENAVTMLTEIAAEELASINELERVCWAEKKYALVLRAKQLKVRLLLAAAGVKNGEPDSDDKDEQLGFWKT
ncbi:MAG: hypothetical protein COX20_11070 [Desulfobacterales bacterium CG23_combo_of_CG06-09_8_20_14_all_52_9]|nr:MAG: hypothetical protein COX20_11070 [Desulfobacterales bacterium CG23_combo_of_CG06-09_8_20_14_all_52_9]